MNNYFCQFSRGVVQCSSRSFYILKYFLFVGQSYSETRILSSEVVKAFCEVSRDFNPIHRDLEFIVSKTEFERPVVHGALLNSLVSSVIGTKLPGPGTVVIKQELNFPTPCYVGEEVLTKVTVKEVRKIVTVTFTCSSLGKTVLEGYSKLITNKL